MTTARKAQGLTILVLTAALAIAAFRARTGAAANSDPTPQDVIYNMLDAARDGNLAPYLDSYTGQMEQSLRKSIAESGEPGFAKYLRESNASLKGIALQEPQALTGREVKVRVEYVFHDRNEVQFLYLEKTARGWKIARADTAERIKTSVPYGTLVP